MGWDCQCVYDMYQSHAMGCRCEWTDNIYESGGVSWGVNELIICMSSMEWVGGFHELMICMSRIEWE